MDEPERKRQLLIELARSRTAMARAGGGVRHGLDLTSRLRESVQENPQWWIGSAAVGVGLILLVARVLRRPVVQVPRLRSKSAARETAEAAAKPAAAGAAFGIITTLGTWIWPLVKPMVMSWVTKKAGGYLGPKRAS